MLAIINASDDDFNNLYNNINNADGAAKSMADTMQDNLEGDLTTLSSGMEGAGIKISEVLTPALRGVVQELTSAVSWFNSLDEGSMKVVIAVGGIVSCNRTAYHDHRTRNHMVQQVKRSYGHLTDWKRPINWCDWFCWNDDCIFSCSNWFRCCCYYMDVEHIRSNLEMQLVRYLMVSKKFFGGFIDFVTGIFTGDYDLALQGIETMTEGFKDIIGGIFDAIVAIFNNVDKFITGIFTNDWTKSFGIFGNVMNAFSANVINVWSGIKQTFDGITGFLRGVFTGNWTQIWQGVVNIFKGVFSTIASIAKAPLNGVIGLINAAISGINKISIDIPKWVPGVGGKHFGANFSKIPYLAKGGNVFKGSAILVKQDLKC